MTRKLAFDTLNLFDTRIGDVRITLRKHGDEFALDVTNFQTITSDRPYILLDKMTTAIWEAILHQHGGTLP